MTKMHRVGHGRRRRGSPRRAPSPARRRRGCPPAPGRRRAACAGARTSTPDEPLGRRRPGRRLLDHVPADVVHRDRLAPGRVVRRRAGAAVGSAPVADVGRARAVATSSSTGHTVPPTSALTRELLPCLNSPTTTTWTPGSASRRSGARQTGRRGLADRTPRRPGCRGRRPWPRSRSRRRRGAGVPSPNYPPSGSDKRVRQRTPVDRRVPVGSPLPVVVLAGRVT